MASLSVKRLREKGGGEVAIPAYEAMQENGLSERVLDVLMRGISAEFVRKLRVRVRKLCAS